MNTVLSDKKTMKDVSKDPLSHFQANASLYKNMTVLIVDNFDSIRSTVAAMLIEAGFKKILQASNGVEAVTVMSSHRVDMIISEWQLPKLEGIELLRRVRLDPRTAQIPFVMTSSTIEQAEVIRAIKNGVSEYVVKPFSAKILLERLKRAIEFPVKHTASVLKKDKEKATGESKRFQILVVDDMPDNIQVISDLLRHDYHIRAATSGEKALKLALSENQPDLILLDIMMPGMDGLEVCKKLKSQARTQHIAIIFLTALDQTEDVVKGLELGAVDYITKPINAEILKARVKTHSKVVEAGNVMRDQVDTLMEMARLKEEFDRVVKNDLKQPIEEIEKTLEFLTRYGRDPNKFKQSCTAIKGATYQLNKMIDDMLVLAQIEDGTYQLNPESLNLNSILSEVFGYFQTSIHEKRLELHYEHVSDHLAVGEHQLCASLLCNLFKNAIEASPRGAAIKVHIEDVGDAQQVQISNQGAIPNEIESRFFDKYISSGKRNSTGLGTYSAKLMTEVQNGSIRFESSEQNGTTLFVSLPK